MAKTLTGVVASNAANKTISVVVTSRETHPIYGKQYTVSRKYLVHDENNEAKKGDKVDFVEIRPVSKRKSFKLLTIVEKSHDTIELKDDVVEVNTQTAATDRVFEEPSAAKIESSEV